MTFGDRLKELREGAGLTRRGVAGRTNVHNRETVKQESELIQKAEAGEFEPSVYLLLDWSDALDLTDEQTEELVARRMAERYGCGDSWEMWEMPAARVIEEVRE